MIAETTMAPQVDIDIAEAEQQIAETFDVMHQLRPNLVRQQYVPMIRYLMKKEGFVVVALRERDIVRAVAGFRVITMLYRGRILYVDDLVTDANSRSRGHGAMMLDWLKKEARKRQCNEIQLISRTFRLDAHRFYERNGFGTECRHFCYPLTEASRM
jgi:GNAT superfamily N-acetyltransferase